MAWVDHDMFDCTRCTDNMKRANGCTDRPRNRDGSAYSWEYPPDRPEVSLDTCPANAIREAPDVVEVFRALNLSGASVGVSDQQELPPPYLEALALANFHQGARSVWRMENERKKARAKRHVR
jgi:hypothetical protein